MRMLIAALLLITGCTREMTWPLVDRAISAQFPEVRFISTDSLASLLESGRKPLLLDVRTAEEFDVSHLLGAERVDPDSLSWSGDDSTRLVVTYCSVGYRSAAMAERLQESGYRNVVNLRGSIFRWANERRPVYRDSVQVHDVHPFDAVWAGLLDARLRSDEPR
ncbi:MAG: rhodanese-like domain-containing protein [Rhodothermales bacterium]